MPVQVARRRANSRRGSRLGRREKRGRTVNFNGELAGPEVSARELQLPVVVRSISLKRVYVSRRDSLQISRACGRKQSGCFRRSSSNREPKVTSRVL